VRTRERIVAVESASPVSGSVGATRRVRWSRVPGFLALLLLFLPTAANAQRRSRPQPLVAADGTVDWNRYYSAAETNEILTALGRRYPKLTRVYSIGKSYKGADLMVVEVTNEETGPASEKPALYLDGGIHAGELTGSAVALYVLNHLLRNYGRDTAITRLLDTRAFYIRPKFNPDGSDLALLEDQRLRSTVHPWDEDGDGTADEDPPEDLNKDGWITQMRVRDPRGDMKPSPLDARALVPREPGDSTGPFYFVSTEGIDNDDDGRFNEDGIGGIDMNRNFPGNWAPEYLQPGAGPFPLSEPETYATVKFIDEHANIASIVHGHTSGGFVYRLPSASDPSKFDRTDLGVIEDLGQVYTATTGRPVQPSATHPTEHRYGTLIEWAYQDRGIIGWVPEYVPPMSWVTDYDGNGRVTEEEQLRFDDEKLGGRYFSPWKPFPHPQLGEVEIGGWHRKFWGQNTPPEYLEAECRAQVPWILYLAGTGPRLALGTPRVRAVDAQHVRIEVEVRNDGWLPTYLTERGFTGRETRSGIEDQIVRPPTALLELTGGTVQGPPRIVIGHLGGESPHSKKVTETSRMIEWTVRVTGRELRFHVVAEGGPAGSARSTEVVYR
jgi:hypothetical protein